MDDFAAPVKGILKALDNGIKLAKRVSKSTKLDPAAQALHIPESAHDLQNILEESSKVIIDAYRHSHGQCGDPFTRALAEDREYSCVHMVYSVAHALIDSLQPKLKELRIDLIDQLNECVFDEDEPDTINPSAFESAQQQAEKCCNECINIFNELGARLLQDTLQEVKPDERPKDGRAQLNSVRSASREPVLCHSPQPSTSPQHDRPVLTLDTPPAESVKPRSPWSVDGIPLFNVGAHPASEEVLNPAPVPQAPYRGDVVLVKSPISEYSEDINLQRAQGPPYPVSPTDQSAGRLYSESPLTEQPPPLIGKEVVYSRLSQNEQFLERRRQSRLLFQSEMRKSVSSIEENRASQTFSDSSIISLPSVGYSTILGSSERPPVPQKGPSGRNERPISATERSGSRNEGLVPLGGRPSSSSYNERNRISEACSNSMSPILGHSIRPIDGRTSRGSATGYDTLMTRQRSQGQASQTTRSSRTSSIVQEIRLQDHPTAERKDSHASQASQGSIFGLRNAAPLSPPLSEHRSSGNESRRHLAATLRVPSFGEGVEPGIEVVDNVDRNNGLILANEDQIVVQPTPTASMGSIGAPIRPDSSFYRFGGFCEGAKALLRGEQGFKVMKRPAVRTSTFHSNCIISNRYQGHYSATVSARCIKCSYEVGWSEVEKDRILDIKGIYGNHGIRFRQRFISKCHIRTNSVDEAMYACIFCIEEHRTVEEHDATIFFSVSKLFSHLAKHVQPLPNIAGLTIIYGFQPPEVLDFDVHFTMTEPKFPQFSMMEIAPKASSRPAATASATHHPRNTRSGHRDPEGNLTLHFAAGARIVGITFPERFHGQWCVGYHDGERGSFPANTITLEMPVPEDVLMNAQSKLVAFAKWDFKLKDAKEGGWLKFTKGDRISAVGYTFQDQWCWSGQTGSGSKAKFGLFPAAFVDGLREDIGNKSVEGRSYGKLGTSPGSVKKSSLGLGSLGSIIGRHKSSRGHERSASVRSNGSAESGGGLGGMVAIQPAEPGLEVVATPLH
jgi:hypothetical protein